MNFYTASHKHYCGIDLHARTMYLCVLSQQGVVLLHRNLPCDPQRFLLAIQPYREDLVVAVECIYTWYWLADLCAKEQIPFVLGHALYMRAIYGAKAKNDRIDSHKTAALLRGGLMPQAYVYPAEMRATRDLMRRRLHFVRQRASLLAHIQMTHHQYNLDRPGKRISYRVNRDGLGEGFEDVSVRQSIAADLALIDHYEVVIGELELAVLRQARVHDPNAFGLLTTLPGIGKVLGLTILYEIHDIRRFPSVQDFASYSRLVKCEKSLGTSGAKIGNAHLKWAFSEAAVLFIAKCPQGKTLLARLEKKVRQAQSALDPRTQARTRCLLHARSQPVVRPAAFHEVVTEERGEPAAELEPHRVEPDRDATHALTQRVSTRTHRHHGH